MPSSSSSSFASTANIAPPTSTSSSSSSSRTNINNNKNNTQKNDNTAEIPAHESLCDVFRSTVSSLANDAAVLRQLASLSVVVGMECSTSSPPPPSSRRHDENEDPNGSCSNNNDTTTNQQQQQQPTIHNLREMNDAITSLEERMGLLQEVLMDEQKAIEDLERTKQEAEEQSKWIAEMEAGCALLKLPGSVIDEKHVLKQDGNAESFASQQKQKQQHQSRAMTPPMTSNGVIHNKPSSSSSCSSLMTTPDDTIIKCPSRIPTTKTNTNKQQQQQQGTDISMTLVTEHELSRLPRSMRGRITLASINDALSDIEHVCRTKYTILARSSPTHLRRHNHHHPHHNNNNHHHHSGGGKKKASSPSYQQYQQQLAAHLELEMDEHDGKHWVSEQDLRDKCAFFRSGESSARQLISILRYLKRLKQVCGRHSQFSYICLPPTSGNMTTPSSV